MLAFVNCRDRLLPLERLVSWLETAGVDDIRLLDNASTYEPLVEYLDNTPHTVIRLGRNAGSKALFTEPSLAALIQSNYFIYSDPDVVPDLECAPDALDRFRDLLDRYPVVQKVGFGLRIDDLPDHYPHKQLVQAWEEQFWREEVEEDVFFAPIDTTLALYRPTTDFSLGPSLRTGGKYVARHDSWYLDPNNLPADEAHYRQYAERASTESPDNTNWSSEQEPSRLWDAIEHDPNPFGVQFFKSSGWHEIPAPTDEKAFTPWAETGWSSWNAMSPEVEIVDAMRLVSRLVAPERVLETGVGQGFTTRAVLETLGPDQQYLGFESDDLWRTLISARPEFRRQNATISDRPTPSDSDFASVDLAILDSDTEFRYDEIDRWSRNAKPGAFVFIHDAGNGHQPEMVHMEIRRSIQRARIQGVFLSNPRGAFIGVNTPVSAEAPGHDEEPVVAEDAGHDSDRSAELQNRIKMLEEETAALRVSRSYRITAPLRRVERGRRIVKAWVDGIRT